jgi:hypothetical protein
MTFAHSCIAAAALAAIGLFPSGAMADDPVLQGRIAEAAYFNNQLWLRGALTDSKTGGGLVSIDLASGARTQHMDRGVIDIDVSDGKLWVLRQATESGRYFTILEWKDGVFMPEANTPAGTPQPIALIAANRKFVVLTPVSIQTYDRSQSRWLPQKLRGALRYGPTFSVAMPASGNVIYFGANAVPSSSETAPRSGASSRGNTGESVGVLQRIDVSNGSVRAIQKMRTSNPCDGPLSSDCTTITAIVPDTVNSECVIVAIGLVQDEVTDGRLLRVCGDQVTVLLEPKAAVQPADTPIVMTEPIYALAPAPGGFWAASAKGLYRFRGDAHTEFPMSKAEKVADITIGRSVPGAIVVPTRVQSALSVSGFAVLVVATGP